jgi:hypothetical protein
MKQRRNEIAKIMAAPLSECDMQLALALRRIRKTHGSLGNYFAQLEAERKGANELKSKEQMRQLLAA